VKGLAIDLEIERFSHQYSKKVYVSLAKCLCKFRDVQHSFEADLQIRLEDPQSRQLDAGLSLC
jgi:hypothetical protein